MSKQRTGVIVLYPDTNAAPLGDQIRNAREAAGMSQEELAQTTNLWQSYISEAEGGHRVPGHAVLSRIAEALSTVLVVSATKK